MTDFQPLIAPLFVPATRPAQIAKAAQSGTDAIIIDLEDAVPASQKKWDGLTEDEPGKASGEGEDLEGFVPQKTRRKKSTRLWPAMADQAEIGLTPGLAICGAFVRFRG